MKKILIIGGVLVLLAVAAYFSLPAYRHWKQQRFLRHAREYFAKGDFQNAILSGKQALTLDASDVEVCRIMARISENIHSPSAVDWWQKIVNLEPASVSNRLDLARAALMFGNYARADQALSGVAKADQNTATFQQLAGMVAAAENNIVKADWFFSRAAELDPQNKSVLFNQAVIHLQAKNSDLVRDAEKTMVTLSADPLFRRNALRHLIMSAIREKNFSRAGQYAAEMQTATDATFDDRLLQLAILKAQASPDFAALLEKLKGEAAKNADDVYAMATWLVGHDLSGDAQAWLAILPDSLQTRPAVRMARADTLMARNDWAGLSAFLTDQNWNELEFVRLAELARAAYEQKQNMVYQANWQAAVHAAGDRLKSLTFLARLAATWNWNKEREELLWSIVQHYPSERWALKSLNQLYTAAGNTRGLQKVYTTLADYDAADPVAKNNLASILMLLNVQTSRAFEMAHAAYTQYTNNPAFASTYAFSLHLQGQTAEGLKILNALPPARLEEPGIATYYGVLLAAAGETNKAKKYLDIAAAAQLLPEEKELIRAARSSQ